VVALAGIWPVIEANLPSNPCTREVMEGGRPWEPREFLTADAILSTARERLERR
jgi:hypothetical protein